MSKALWLTSLLLLTLASGLSSADDAAVLAELDAALVKQAPFQTQVRYASKELGVTGTLHVAYARAEGRMFLRREETSPEALTTYALFEPGRATYWSDEGSQRFVYDLAPLLDGLHAFMSARELSQGRQALSPEAFRATVGAQIQLGIGAHAMETRPSLEVGLGVSSLSRASWIAELRDAPEPKLELTPKLVKATGRGGRSYVIDRETGFFRSQRLELQSSTFTLEAGDLEPLKAFPETKPPADVPTEELPIHVFVGLLRNLVEGSVSQGLHAAEGEALERAAEGYTLLAASASQARLHHLARSEARRYVQHRLESGATLESLRAEVEKEAAGLAKHLERAFQGIEREEERELADLRKSALRGVAADSPQAKALTAALNPARVRAARKAPASAKSHLEAVLASWR